MGGCARDEIRLRLRQEGRRDQQVNVPGDVFRKRGVIPQDQEREGLPVPKTEDVGQECGQGWVVGRDGWMIRG